MTTERWRVTYDRVTEESAEQGDSDECGWAHYGGWRYPVEDPGPHEMTLREALKFVYPSEDCGRWFCSAPEPDYREGFDETLCLHPPQGITPASYARVKRLLKIR